MSLDDSLRYELLTWITIIVGSLSFLSRERGGSFKLKTFKVMSKIMSSAIQFYNIAEVIFIKVDNFQLLAHLFCKYCTLLYSKQTCVIVK